MVIIILVHLNMDYIEAWEIQICNIIIGESFHNVVDFLLIHVDNNLIFWENNVIIYEENLLISLISYTEIYGFEQNTDIKNSIHFHVVLQERDLESNSCSSLIVVVILHIRHETVFTNILIMQVDQVYVGHYNVEIFQVTGNKSHLVNIC